MMIRYTKARHIYFILSAALIIASFWAILGFGLSLGIDFLGGSILEITYEGQRPMNQEIKESLKSVDLGEVTVQPTGTNGVILRMKEIDDPTHRMVLDKLGEGGKRIDELRFESVGPVISQELKGKTGLLVTLALLSMIFYIAFAFRRVQRPLKSWQFALTSLVALLHDILIPLGIFAWLRYDITIPVITAFLTVLGYSINNVVVVFDRIREIILKKGGSFDEIIDRSLNQTLTRQISTSLTTLLPLIAIYLLGGETLKYFSLALILGIISGMYSSFLIAAPLLLIWKKVSRKGIGS